MDDIREKLGALDAKVTAAHSRVDKIESGIKDDLKEIKDDIKGLSAYMHKSQGFGAALMMVAGAAGAGIVHLINYLIK